MKKAYIAITILILTLVWVYTSAPTVKYRYAVRENITDIQGGISWEQYCWTEFSNNSVDKAYVGHYAAYGDNTDIDRVEIPGCSK